MHNLFNLCSGWFFPESKFAGTSTTGQTFVLKSCCNLLLEYIYNTREINKQPARERCFKWMHQHAFQYRIPHWLACIPDEISCMCICICTYICICIHIYICICTCLSASKCSWVQNFHTGQPAFLIAACLQKKLASNHSPRQIASCAIPLRYHALPCDTVQYYTISDLERPKDPHLVKQSFE